MLKGRLLVRGQGGRSPGAGRTQPRCRENWPGLGPRGCTSTWPLKARLCFQMLSAAPSVTTPREIWGTGVQRQLRWVRKGCCP